MIQGQVFEDADLSSRNVGRCRANAPVFEAFGVWISGAATVHGNGRSGTACNGHCDSRSYCPRSACWRTSDDGSPDEDDTPGSPETVILSYGYWQRRFGGDPQVLGRAIVIDFVPHQVIGVMPRDFRLVDVAPEMLLPALSQDAAQAGRIQLYGDRQAQAGRVDRARKSGFSAGLEHLGGIERTVYKYSTCSISNRICGRSRKMWWETWGQS